MDAFILRRTRAISPLAANLQTHTPLIPPPGVYAARVVVHGAQRGAVINVCHRPTFDGDDLRFEVHLLDWSGDLYGQELGVALVQRLRSEQRFEDVDALVRQIRADVKAARTVLT